MSEEKEGKKNKAEKKGNNKVEEEESGEEASAKTFTISWKMISVVLLVLLVASVIFNFVGPSPSSATGSIISADNVADKVQEYVTSMAQGADVSLESINDTGFLYQVGLKVSSPQGDQVFSFYATKDGENIIFPNGMRDLDNIPQTQTQNQGQNTQTQDVPKSDTPKIDLYVMSFCPYGNQAENTMEPVYNLLKNKVDFNTHYIVSTSGDTVRSLHGQKEVDQDMREACVLEEYGMDKWWTFATYVNDNCGSSGSCWQDAASEADMDVNTIETCVVDKGLQLMKAEEKAANSAGASSSPTLKINGVKSRAVYQYGNPNAYKEAICSAFNDQPDACSESLGSSGSTTSSGGRC